MPNFEYDIFTSPYSLFGNFSESGKSREEVTVTILHYPRRSRQGWVRLERLKLQAEDVEYIEI